MSTTQLYQRIRNIQLRLLPQNELLPVEVAKYDQKIVVEALHNCIAHQDYTRHGRVVVTEQPDRLVFENEGSFFDLPLADVLALDRVQKKLPIPDEAVVRLRRMKLIEGRKPRYHVSATVAEATASKADYIRTRAQDDAFYAKLLTDYLRKFGQAGRTEINQLLLPKLSDALDDRQKYNKVSSLLTKLRRGGVMVNTGSDTAPSWRLAERTAGKR